MDTDLLASHLAEFEADPSRAMNRHMQRITRPGLDRREATSLLVAGAEPGGAFVGRRAGTRRRLRIERGGVLVRMGQVGAGRAAFDFDELPDDVVDVDPGEILRTLEDIEAAGLKQAQLPATPWSDWYWPMYQGQLGARYADPAFPLDSEDWGEKQAYVQAHPAAAIVAAGADRAISALSPAEKYDLLVGDEHFGLTRSQWAEGERHRDGQGQVSRWMGLCHGWAPASYLVERPRAAHSILAADGKTRLLFYPSDLKGLASLLWASTEPPSRGVGGRCEDERPKMDAIGRVTTKECFDSNPGTWHLAVVNQLGVARRSLVIDATYDFEVWNQPLFGYRYRYFNPVTLRPVRSLKQARVAMDAFPKDRFRAYRSPAARSVIGIGMDLTYVAETMPDTARKDGPKNDLLKTVSYSYDLELDGDGVVIGGEWYTNEHPDFLWTPPQRAVAQSTMESAARGRWQGERVPASWRAAAIAAARNGQPLGKLIMELIRRSRA